MNRRPVNARRARPRRRHAPQWNREQWADADLALGRRSGLRCECCGEPTGGRYERHHRMRRRDGGDRLANLMVLRPRCHAYWTEHPAEARARGIIVSALGNADVADVPVIGYSGLPGAVYLDDRGRTRRARAGAPWVPAP